MKTVILIYFIGFWLIGCNFFTKEKNDNSQILKHSISSVTIYHPVFIDSIHYFNVDGIALHDSTLYYYAFDPMLMTYNTLPKNYRIINCLPIKKELQDITLEELDTINLKQDYLNIYKCAVTKDEFIFKVSDGKGNNHTYTIQDIVYCNKKSPFELLFKLDSFFHHLRENIKSTGCPAVLL